MAAELSKLKLLPPAFYERNTLQVASDLLGKILIVKSSEGITAGRIVETEAYRADDPAAHSFRGETPRSSVMFGQPCRAYVYFIYGMYEMLNFVTEPKGQAGAVLIRALEPVQGLELMRARRRAGRTSARSIRDADLLSGPGKLCRALGIQLSHNGASLRGPALRVVDDHKGPLSISVSPRVGISVAKERLWRFFITGDPHVSRALQNSQACEVSR